MDNYMDILYFLLGGLITILVCVITIYSSFKMWRNEVFIKKAQEEIILFYDLLKQNIDENFSNNILCSILENNFDYEQIEFNSFFRKKLDESLKLERQCISISKILKKWLNININYNVLNFIRINIVVYSYIVNIQNSLSMEYGPVIDDYFDIDYNSDRNEEKICNMLKSSQNELVNNFIMHCKKSNINLVQNSDNSININQTLNIIQDELKNLENKIQDFIYKVI